jgi:hypothetical protein
MNGTVRATRRAFGEFCKLDPQTQWLPDPSGTERYMTMLRDFDYVDPTPKRWPALSGLQTDGASIPRAFWTLVGSLCSARIPSGAEPGPAGRAAVAR